MTKLLNVLPISIIVFLILILGANLAVAQGALPTQEECDNMLPGLRDARCDWIQGGENQPQNQGTTPAPPDRGGSQGSTPAPPAGGGSQGSTPAPPEGGSTGSSSESGSGGSQSQSTSIEFENPLDGISSIEGLLATLLNVLIVIATPLVVIFIILAGFKYVTAQGDETKLTEAKRALVYAIIGGVLIIGATAIADIISGTVNAFRNN